MRFESDFKYFTIIYPCWTLRADHSEEDNIHNRVEEPYLLYLKLDLLLKNQIETGSIIEKPNWNRICY